MHTILVNYVDVHASVELFNMSDEDFTYLLLGKKWHKMRKRQSRETFYCMVSKLVQHFIPGILATYKWYKP